MFGIGGFELFLILLFGFLIFGPDKLPAIAKTIGQALAKFRSAQEEMNKVIKTEVYDPNSDEPFKNPLDALEKLGDAGKSAVTGKPSASKAAEKKPQEKQESFSERKARYDKERAAKKAAEAEAASEPASSQSAKAEASAKPATASAPAEQAAESAIEEKKGE
ncbi:MAG: twin-arginine translocase TatA/TatE family subunit [Eggerthellaceae bacterium]|nr:twin-arginine translocase TatA/TatE family subunit [Eggerthellaceae bacterium]